MKHLKSIYEFKAVNEQLFGNYGKALANMLFGDDTSEPVETGESPISGSVTNIPVSGDKAKNVQALMDAMKRHGITNPYTQRAILGTVGKESGSSYALGYLLIIILPSSLYFKYTKFLVYKYVSLRVLIWQNILLKLTQALVYLRHVII